jgi:hypothetical protein
MTPAEQEYLRDTKLTLNLQARKVRPESLEGDLGHHDVRPTIKRNDVDTS